MSEIIVQKSPVEMEPTMELRWKAEPGTSAKKFELQQAFWMKGDCTKRKVWCPIRIEIASDE